MKERARKGLKDLPRAEQQSKFFAEWPISPHLSGTRALACLH